MAASVIHHSVAAGNASGATSASIDSTGAKLIVVAMSSYAAGSNFPGTPTDNKGNTYTGLTSYTTPTSLDRHIRFYYCLNPVVGTGHVISFSGTNVYGSIGVAMFGGNYTFSFDKQAGTANGSAVTSLQPGSLTPAAIESVLISAVCTLGANHLINSSYTGLNVSNNGTVFMGLGFGYKVRTSSAAENPQHSWTTSSASVANHAIFTATPLSGLLLANAAYLTGRM